MAKTATAKAAPSKTAAKPAPNMAPKAKTPEKEDTKLAKQPSKEVTKAANTAVAAVGAVPDFMQQYAGQGVEQVSQAETEIPRIKLIQAISPELETFNDLKAGDFFHSIAEISLGQELRIVPIFTDMRYILWRPRWEGGGILARADDGVHWNPPNAQFEVKPVKGSPQVVSWKTAPTVAASGLTNWGSSNPSDPNSQPAATKMYNMLVAFPDNPDLGMAIVTLQRAGVKVARKLMGKLKITRAPAYGQVFVMRSVNEQGQEGPFKNYSFEADGFVTDKDQFEAFRGIYETFSKSGLNIDPEKMQDDVETHEGREKAGQPGF